MKEFIEIPFGAKDSELGGWEYNIPEGMEATIVDNKIVVKKKESEDERIRKYLLKLADRCPEDSIDFMGEVKKEDVIAWLEKQGEQKPAWSEEDEEIKYIKSLKDRVQPQTKQEWKPSEEQIKDFGSALLILKLQHYVSVESLDSLYEQLKKL